MPTGGSTSHRTRFLPKRDLAGTGGVGSWFKRRIDDITPDGLDIQETTELMPVDYWQEAIGDLRLVYTLRGCLFG